MSHHTNATGQFRVPSLRMIGKGPETEQLYKAEERTTRALSEAASRLQEFLVRAGVAPEPLDHHRDIRPEAILTVLEGQPHGAALVACMAYLDWYRENRPEAFRAARIDWETQRGTTCPVCEGAMKL